MHVTYHDTERHTSMVSGSSPESGAAPGTNNDITDVVTSAMVEAAEGLLFSFDRDFDYADDYLRKIYQAMEAARIRGLL